MQDCGCSMKPVGNQVFSAGFQASAGNLLRIVPEAPGELAKSADIKFVPEGS